MSSTPGKRCVELVVFDLGRVLLRIADDWAHASTLAGLPQPAQLQGDISTATQRGGDPGAQRIIADFEIGRVEPTDFFAWVASATKLSAAEAQQVLEAWLIAPYPGVDALLSKIDVAKMGSACLSNTNAHHWQLMTDPTHRAYLPLHRLTFRFASQEIGIAKPEPGIYAHVEQVAAVPAGAILFFDDRPENITAAAARGWQAVLVPAMDNPLPWLEGRLVDYGVLPDEHA